MKILILNDDGIDAPGILTLVEVLREDHELYIAAPDQGMSGMGHAITLKGSIQAKKELIPGVVEAYRIQGTPADCAKIGLLYFFKDIAFDVILSGINNGGNIGTEVIYSGTFAAAHEAHRMGRSVISLSLTNPKRIQNPDFLPAALHFATLLEHLHQDDQYFYNINYPIGVSSHRMQLAVPGEIRYQELIHCEETPEGYSISFDGLPVDWSEAPDTDFKCLQKGIATIVPIRIDWHDIDHVGRLEKKMIQHAIEQAKRTR